MPKSMAIRIDDELKQQAETTLDNALEDLKINGGYEYLGKDENGAATFGDTPIRASL